MTPDILTAIQELTQPTTHSEPYWVTLVGKTHYHTTTHPPLITQLYDAAEPGRLELQIRDQWQIEGSPAGARLDVLAGHRCGDQSLEGLTIPSRHERTSSPLPHEPPY